MGRITSNVGLITGVPIQDTVDQLIALQARQQDMLKDRVKTIDSQATALTELTARLLSFQFQVNNVGRTRLFEQRSVSSSDNSLLTVSSSGTPPLGNYKFTPLQVTQNHQLLSSGIESNTTPLGGGDLTFRYGGFVDKDLSLDLLNAGNGFTRGKIRITDRSGQSAEIDLSHARTVDDVLRAVNNNTTINVRLETQNDRFVLVDQTGDTTANLRVQELSGGTAASLGLAGIDTASNEAVGNDVLRMFDGLRLDQLNDGNGVRFSKALPDLKVTFQDDSSPLLIDFNKLGDPGVTAKGTTAGTNGVNAQLKFTAKQAGTDFNGVAVAFVDDSSVTAGNETVNYDADTKTLTFRIQEGGTTANQVITALQKNTEASKLFTAERATGSAGSGLMSSADSITLAGGVAPIPGGDEKTIGAVLATINAADPARLRAELSSDGDRIILTDLTASGGGTFEVTGAFDSPIAQDLGLTGTAVGGVITGERLLGGLNSTLLRNLNGIHGISELGTLDLTDRAGATANVDLSAAETLQDVITAINAAGIGIQARVNDARNGLLLTDTTGSSAGNLIVANGDANETADKLKIAVDAATTQVNSGNLERRIVSETTALESLRGGQGISRGRFKIVDTRGNEATIDLTREDIKTVGDVLRAIQSTGLAIEARVNDAGDGILIADQNGGSGSLTITDLSGTSAAQLNLAGTAKTLQIDGEDRLAINGSSTTRITLESTDTLQDLVRKINDAGAGVTASTFSDGSLVNSHRLSLFSQAAGSLGELMVDTSGLSFNFSETSRAQDALVVYGETSAPGSGIIASSSTNSFANLVPDLTVRVQGASTSAVNVNVSKVNTDLMAGLTAFAEEYNKLIEQMKQLTKFDPENPAARGVLQGDNNVLRVENELKQLLTGRFFGVGEYRSAKELGLDFDQEGRLSFDRTTFEAAYAADPESVEKFFTDESVGFSKKLTNTIDQLAGTERSLLSVRLGTLNRKQDDLQVRIELWDSRLESSRELLLRKFTQMELTIGKLQNNMSALESIQAIPPMNSN